MNIEISAEKIGERLKELRGYKPRRVVAEETGINLNTLISYETGERVPRDINKVVLANYYGKSVEEIFFTP